MINEQIQRVKELFQAAAELDVEARERFLNEHCGGDAALRARVETLLGADRAVPGRFLNGASEGHSDPPAPERIGRFRVIRRIGAGGMGTVFEAEQDHPRRTVALKIIRAATVSESVLRRFDHEVQILGTLRHPGIAQIYEAGKQDDGSGMVVYFSMEYIKGSILTEFVKRHDLKMRERLRLVADVCDAVHHAHLRGIVHRDLKPANILVEDADAGGPHPKILDFGVARAVQSDLQVATMHTEAGQLVGTLSYMSPEQVSGRPDEVDACSDVYALGIILYEVLSGSLPYDLRNYSIPEAGSVICNQEPTSLSSADASLRGDVETIVGKALAKEKGRRYQSAAELADDIRRFLRDEPIVARPASRAYQLGKFAKRNKVLVGGIAAVFLTLAVGIVAVTAALVKATEANRIAEQRSEESRVSAAKATAVSNFLQEMLASVDPAKSLGREVTIRQALDEAAIKIASGYLHDQPEVESDLRATIGATYLALGHYAESETHLREALAIRRKLHGDTHADVAMSLHDLAVLFSHQGRYAESESILREALEIQQRLHVDHHVDLASTMQALAAALRSQQKYDEAEPLYRAALDMRRELLGGEHVDVAQSVNSLALLLQNKGDYIGAEPLFREALALRRKLLGEPHPLVADSLNNLANLLNYRRNTSESESLLREALAMRRVLLGPEHPGLAQGLNNLAAVLYDNRNYAEAEPLYREALAIWGNTLPEGHPDIGSAAIGLGLVLTALGKHAEAEPFLRDSLKIREATLPEGHPARFGAMSALGAALAGQGKFPEAETLLISGYEGLRDHPQVPQDRKRLALDRIIHLYDAWNRPDHAARWRRELPVDTAGDPTTGRNQE